MKHIICTVTTDLTYDQRMQRICASLVSGGYRVTLVGRKRRISKPLRPQPWHQYRLHCWFQKGKLFYAEYNIRLYFYLLFHGCDLICAVDLDSILPCFYISQLKNLPLVYDAHEYFPEMEEVVRRPKVKGFWEAIECRVVPHISAGYTVSSGIAEHFREKYDIEFQVVRNITRLYDLPDAPKTMTGYILYQGAVNEGRGLESLVRAFQFIDQKLVICGYGDLFEELVDLADSLGLSDKIMFKGYVEPENLRDITLGAIIGTTLFDNKGKSNQYSLANRFFDYIHAGVPQVAMAYPEYQAFNGEFEVATLIPDLEVSTIADAINGMLQDHDRYAYHREECMKARQVHCWQNEEIKLMNIYDHIFKDKPL